MEVEQLVKECGANKQHGGFIDVTDHQDLSPKGLTAKVPQDFPTPSHESIVDPLFSKISVEKLRHFNDKLTAFHTRYYTTDSGKFAAEWIATEFIAMKGSRSDITVELFPHGWKQCSIIARIRGSTNPDEIVIVSSHEDSISNASDSRAPGADDDASGTSTVLETFRVIVESGWIPDRTIEFHTYAAEEVGLRGSQDIASYYQKNSKEVYAQMQLDMTFFKSNPEEMGIVTDYVNADLTTFITQLAALYVEIPVKNTRCGYGCSDHASWYKAGYASSFPFETEFSKSNKAIHTNKDTLALLDLNHGVQFVRIALGFVVELGSD